MGGTRAGGLKSAETNKKFYGEDHYVRAGAISGKLGKKDGVIKGFAAMPRSKRVEAGRIGGTRSRRGPAK